ncbi:HD domain-containing protein [Candidatus Daviesbacteria bacterium]|nr:HD domain-containing protein [Candidatus Daviesbacteria bacterium]
MHLPKEVEDILNKFQKAGFQIYIVGGAVRDILMGKEVNDWDFTTDAKPEEILKIIPEGFYDNKFGTVGIPTKNTSGVGFDSPEVEVFEVTTMRKEGDYKDFRHPAQVGWTDKIEEDLARRDFTINAIALGIESRVKSQESRKINSLTLDSSDLTLIDPYHGEKDIHDKIIRTVGNPNDRFKEDALRLIRAIRIATQLKFEIEIKTFEAIKENAGLIEEIAKERVRNELFKILSAENPLEGINKLREAGILQIILPELERCFGIVQQGPKHDRVYDIGEHSLMTLQHTPSKNSLVRLAALLHDIGKVQTVKTESDGNVTFYNHDVYGGRLVLQIAQRFNLSKKQTDKLYKLVRWHLFTVDENQTDSAIRRFINNVGLENIEDMMAVRIGDRLGGGTQRAVSWRMEKFNERIKQVLQKPFSISDLKVNGNDIMEVLNIKSGPKIGEILQKLFEEVLENAEKNNKDYLLNRIKELA